MEKARGTGRLLKKVLFSSLDILGKGAFFDSSTALGERGETEARGTGRLPKQVLFCLSGHIRKRTFLNKTVLRERGVEEAHGNG